MTIKTYTNNSDRNEIYKNLTNEATITNAILKEDCSISDPVLILSGTSVLANNVNYVYIQSFGRYYFIESKEMSQQRQYVTLHCDVLESARSEILDNYAVIERSENKFNAYQVDSDMPMINSSEITVTRFNNSFNGESLILAVAGGTPATP